MGVKGYIGIKDNVTAILRSVKKEQSKFRKDVESTRKAMEKAYDKKHTARVNSSPAMKAIKIINKSLEPLRKKIVKVVAVKDLAKSKLNAIRNNIKAVGMMSVKPVVAIKDKVAAGIGRVKGALGKLKAVAIPITVALAGGTAALSSTLASGMKLEQQKISMEHFIGATNKDLGSAQIRKIAAGFTKELRDNANATPFETGEVMQAGSRAIAISGGNTKEALGLVKLAEDMAAASGGTKNISDAIEALADAKVGEMERLKEFGFKVSAEAFKSKGFKGVAKDLGNFYGGASEKLAKSGEGILSTIKGKLSANIADLGLNLVKKLKPSLEKVIPLLDKISPHFKRFGDSMASGIKFGIDKVAGFMPAISSVIPVIQSVISTAVGIFNQASPIIAGVVGIISSTIQTMAPVFSMIFNSISAKVGSVISFVSERMGFVQTVFSSVLPAVAEILTTAWSIMSPVSDTMITVFKAVWKVVEFVFPAIKTVITSVWGVLKPIFSALAEALTWVGDAVESVVGWFGDVFHGVFDKPAKGAVADSPGRNARGTDNWRGGLTWIGEEGPELVDLPKGSRVLPSKASMRLMKDKPLPVPNMVSSNSRVNNTKKIVVNIPKLADSIVVREDADIDKIGEKIVKKLEISKLIVE